jgi:hypothetical protein
VDARYGPFPMDNVCSTNNNTVWTVFFADQQDIDFWNPLIGDIWDHHSRDGVVVTVPMEHEQHEPPFVGERIKYLTFCPGGAAPYAGTWQRESWISYMYAKCWPGLDDPPDPRSNPSCWWGVACIGDGESCKDLAYGYIS